MGEKLAPSRRGDGGRTMLELAAQHRLLRGVSSHLRGLPSGSNELHGVWRRLAEFAAVHKVTEVPKNPSGHR